MIYINNVSHCSCVNFSDLQKLSQENQSNDSAADATWILTSALIIFTMQSGFGLLEAGCVSAKNECNIMIKNVVDVIFGGFSYWIVGFGLTFGKSIFSNGFCGVGDFFADSTEEDMGNLFAKYFFQLSCATTATTIVSGAMAERIKLDAFMLFSLFNFVIYVFPAHWIWSDEGFLNILGAIDIAGSGPVHLVGGAASFIATYMLKPRHGKYSANEDEYVNLNMASPTNVVLGTFMLWWGWLGFNCGSTFGVSGRKWKYATRAAVATINGSIGGGLFGILYSRKLCKKYNNKLDVKVFMMSILGGLVAVTAISAVCRPFEALLIGCIGGVVTCYGISLLERLQIDDPVCCISVHGFSGIWGLISVGLFGEPGAPGRKNALYGVFKNGGFQLLGIQLLTVFCILIWALFATFILLTICKWTIGIRVSIVNEIVGSDFAEHGIKRCDLSSEPKEDIDYLLQSRKEEDSLTSLVHNRESSSMFGSRLRLSNKTADLVSLQSRPATIYRSSSVFMNSSLQSSTNQIPSSRDFASPLSSMSNFPLPSRNLPSIIIDNICSVECHENKNTNSSESLLSKISDGYCLKIPQSSSYICANNNFECEDEIDCVDEVKNNMSLRTRKYTL